MRRLFAAIALVCLPVTSWAASGDTLAVGSALTCIPPATTFAPLTSIAGASTPAENIPVLEYSGGDGTDDYCDFLIFIPSNYAGGGYTLTLFWTASATTNAVVWQAAFRAIPDDAEDLDTTAHTYAFNTVTVGTLPTVIGETSQDDITFTDGADADSCAAGNICILRIFRDPDNASDTHTGSAYLLFWRLKET